VDRFIASPRLLSSEVQGESILLHLDQGQYYGLNKVASYVWQLLQKGATIEELVCSTTARFDVAPQDCERDIRQLLCDLQQHRLISVETAPRAGTTNGQ
jgi:hypothetical protein